MAQPKPARWYQRLRYSLRQRLVALFVLLALLVSGVFFLGVQKAFTIAWRDAARPLLTDYVDRLASDLGSPPSIERAQALVQRLPLTVHISGPKVQWRSYSDSPPYAASHNPLDEDASELASGARLLVRTTTDGHRIEFGLSAKPWRDRPRFMGWTTLGILLLLTWATYALVRRWLQPLDDIAAGARRFGAGRFDQPIVVTHKDELGDLASDVNTMARNIHQMLEAKRALLLAISHELRSPLTRARLHTELLPEAGEGAVQRTALLRDLQEMADLVSDLLESERLSQDQSTTQPSHTALHLETCDLAALVHEVVHAYAQSQPDRVIVLQLDEHLPQWPLDRTRIRLLLRNLLSNALRYSAATAPPPVLSVHKLKSSDEVVLTVRDFGPGVHEQALPHLAEPFYRPDAARDRSSGGVGLGLYLCKLVAQAHGGSLQLANAQPGLSVSVKLPVHASN